MSPHAEILDQAKLALQSALPDATIRVRKRGTFAAQDSDADGLVILFPLTEQEVDEDFELGLYLDYPVGVLIGISSTHLNSASETTMLDMRYLVRRTLRSVTTVAPSGITVVNVRADLNPNFENTAARDNMDISGMVITYTVQEQRAAV